MAVKQKKRRWPDDEKRSICFQTTAAGLSVAQVARRYAMNANLIFKWLKDDRYAPAVDVVPEADGRVSVLLCMTDLAHASKLKEHDDNDDFQGTTGRAA